MAHQIYNELLNAGIIKYTSCSAQENAQYNEMLKNGQLLPEGIVQYACNVQNHQMTFVHVDYPVPLEEQKLYMFMQISKNICFISKFLKIFLVLSIISALVTVITFLGAI